MTTATYRFLDVGDEIHRDDEYFNGTAWIRTKLSSGTPIKYGEAATRPPLYRRVVSAPATTPGSPPPITEVPAPLSPGEGYRFLSAGKIREKGDEYWSHQDGVWAAIEFGGYPVVLEGQYRRRLTSLPSTASPRCRIPEAIHWNPWNKVVQDHRDGKIMPTFTNFVRRELGLEVPWTPDLASKEVGEPPIFLSKGDKPL